MIVEAPAKVNFTLEVFGRRPDGYHDLRSVVMPISLADTLSIEPADELTCDTGFADDLCLKAARALDPARGARIHVEKRIPVGGGLGGGSADAAATLIALNELWSLGYGRDRLAAIGASVGSDVPALVLGGPVLMEGRGERVAPIDGVSRSFDLVLANPGIAVSTREVYARCTSRVTDGTEIVYNMRHALQRSDLAGVAAALMNDLEPAAVAAHPVIAGTIASLRKAGALGVTMSGSGSTVFGLVPDEARGREIAALLNAQGLRAWCVHTLVP